MFKALLSLLLLLTAFTGVAHAQKHENLLIRPDLAFLPDKSVGLALDSTLRIKDENPDTSAIVAVSENTPTELVYSFSGTTVTPTSLKILVAGLQRNQASVEILVSEDGPDVGYLSLRTEPLKGHKNWQSFKFEPAAAKWLMIKFSSYAQATEFELKELEILGYDGTPVSLYAFNEAPSKAIDVINSLEQIDLSFDIHPDESALLEDAQDGQLDSWSFAEASLISSGVYDTDQRAALMEQLDSLTEEARSITAKQESAFDKGRVLLQWLHAESMREGYVERQTNVSGILTNKQYNCVSSATLYNIIGRRLGLDARGIEVPDHAFTILYDGTDHVDVETTTAYGFDPARDHAAMNAFSRTTGYNYISDKHRDKRREIDDAGMIALTYYNHGVTATKNDDYAAALLYYFRALSLDPRNNSAIKNTLAVLSSWSIQEIENENYGSAVKILDAALNFAPADKTSRHNMRYALSKALQAADNAEETSRYASFAQQLHKRTEDDTFLRLQSRALQSKAYEFSQQGNFEDAIALTESLESSTDDRTRREISRLRISLFLNWSLETADAGNHSQAMDLLSRAYEEKPTDSRVKNNIAYIAQEWATAVSANEGAESSQQILQNITARFPEIRSLQKMSARNYDRDAHAAFDAGDYEGAIAMYQTAAKLGTSKTRLKKNEIAVWNRWGLSRLDEGDFSGALTIFERALAAHPRNSDFKNNAAYAVQEWSKSLNDSGNVLEAEHTIAVQSERFADLRKIASLQGNFISSAVNDATTADEFEALAPTLKDVSGLIKQQSRVDKLIGFFYQNWGRTAHADFANDDALAILQNGLSDFPENRHIKKLYVYSVNKLAKEAIDDKDWDRVISIFQSGVRSLPNERSFSSNLEKAKKQI